MDLTVYYWKILYFRVPSKTRREHIRFLSKIKFCKNVSHLLKTFKIKSQRDVSTSKRHAATHHLLTKQLSMWCLHDPKMPQHLRRLKKTQLFRGHVPSPELWIAPPPLAPIGYKNFFLFLLDNFLEPVIRLLRQGGKNRKIVSIKNVFQGILNTF